MNGSTKWVIGVLSIIITLTLVVDAMQTADIDENRRCAIEASERSARNEERGKTQFDEIIRRLDSLDKAVSDLK